LYFRFVCIHQLIIAESEKIIAFMILVVIPSALLVSEMRMTSGQVLIDSTPTDDWCFPGTSSCSPGLLNGVNLLTDCLPKFLHLHELVKVGSIAFMVVSQKPDGEAIRARFVKARTPNISDGVLDDKTQARRRVFSVQIIEIQKTGRGLLSFFKYALYG